jgi:hypothetical protein
MHVKSDPAAAVKHFHALDGFAQRIAGRGFAVYEHHWDVTDSLDWIIVAGRPQQRFEFAWDDAGRVLSISASVDAPESHVQDWGEVTQRAAEDSASAFQEAEHFLDEHAKRPNQSHQLTAGRSDA